MTEDTANQSLTAAPPPRRRRRVRRRRRARFGNPAEWLIVLLALLALVSIVGMLGLVAGERGFFERIYPNISVRGLALGGSHIDTAGAALQRRYAAFLAAPVELTYGDQVWRPSATDLGLALDLDDAIATAAALGRTDTRIDNVRTVAAIWEQGVELPLRMVIDQTEMQRYLLEVARTIELPPRNADLRLTGATLEVVAEADGVQVLVDETLHDLTAALQNLEPQRVAIRTRHLTPQLRDADVAPVIAEVRTLLDGPIVLTNGARAWQWPPEQIAAWISLHRASAADGRPSISLRLDQLAIRNMLTPVAAALREEGSLPRVEWNGGALQITQPGQPGRGLDAPQALAAIDAALQGGPRTIELPMVALPPPVTEANLASLGITAQVAAGVSSFRASEAYRITNIQAGARRMHGILLPPGATFSFNESLGVVDAAGGFVEGLAIVDNRTQKEWGGGLCQVSTTVFRAAFWAGLPISERHEHAFRIGWYEELGEPPGLDAAIFTPYNDLRFVNDTGGWLLLQSGVDLSRQRLTIALYGAPSARQVSMDYRVLERTPAPNEPRYIDDPALPAGYFRQTDTARGGITVEVYRVVRANDRLLRQDTFPTTFNPWPNIFVRGTGGR